MLQCKCETENLFYKKKCSVDIRYWIHHHQVRPFRLHPIDRDVVINLWRMRLHLLHQFYQSLHHQRIFSNLPIRWYHSRIRLPPHHPGTLDGDHRYEKICYEEVYLLVYSNNNPELNYNSKFSITLIKDFCFFSWMLSQAMCQKIICFHIAAGILYLILYVKYFVAIFFIFLFDIERSVFCSFY